jgi:hypothetical protein
VINARPKKFMAIHSWKSERLNMHQLLSTVNTSKTTNQCKVAFLRAVKTWACQENVRKSPLTRKSFIKLDLWRRALAIDSQFLLVSNSPNHGLSEIQVMLNGRKILSLFRLMVMISVQFHSELKVQFCLHAKLTLPSLWLLLLNQEIILPSLDLSMAITKDSGRRSGAIFWLKKHPSRPFKSFLNL